MADSKRQFEIDPSVFALFDEAVPVRSTAHERNGNLYWGRDLLDLWIWIISFLAFLTFLTFDFFVFGSGSRFSFRETMTWGPNEEKTRHFVAACFPVREPTMSSPSPSTTSSASTRKGSPLPIRTQRFTSPHFPSNSEPFVPIAPQIPTERDSSPSSAPETPDTLSPLESPNAQTVSYQHDNDEDNEFEIERQLPSPGNDNDSDSQSPSLSPPAPIGTRLASGPYQSEEIAPQSPSKLTRVKRKRSPSPETVSEHSPGGEKTRHLSSPLMLAQTSPVHLRRHKPRSIVHLRQRPFPCTMCSKVFRKREQITSHVKRMHPKLRLLKRPRVIPPIAEGECLRNAAALFAISSLRLMPIEDRVSERYITALHALDHLIRKRILPSAQYVDKIAHDLVINPSELRRVHALAIFARIAEQKLCEIERLRFRQILAGHRNQLRSGRDGAKMKDSAIQKSRRRKAHPLRGVSIRDARDTLASASWMPLSRNQQAFNVLNGDEIILRMREEGVYIDDVDLVPLNEDDVGVETEASRSETVEWLHAVRELPATERIPTDDLKAVARKVADFAAVLKQAPHLVRLDDADTLLQQDRHMRENEGDAFLRTEGESPSPISYYMALYRAESLKLQANQGTLNDLAGKKEKLRVVLGDMFKQSDIRLHPVVERLLLCTFSSVDELTENGCQLVQFGSLIGKQGRAKLLRCLQDMQIDALVATMKVPDRQMAANLVASFLSARKCLRASLPEVESSLRDTEEAKRVIMHLHGQQTENYNLAALDVQLPYVVGHVLTDEFGSITYACAASFTQVVGPCKGSKCPSGGSRHTLTLTPDERLAAYWALHEDHHRHDETSWARFEASWGLFRQVCQRTMVDDTIGVTIRLLDEQKQGAEVLDWLAAERTEKVCVQVGINADEALRLKSFASTFVPSTVTDADPSQ